MRDFPHLRDAVVTNTILAILGALGFAIYMVAQYNKRNYSPKGCRKLGLSATQSHLHDEFHTKYNQGVPEDSIGEQGRPAWRVKALFTYPIKSCAGIELDEADIVATGFAFDRQFCFAEDVPPSNPSLQTEPLKKSNGTNWTARTLRNRGFNRLALMRPEIWIPDPTVEGYSADLEEVKSKGVLVLYYPRVGRNAIHSSFLNLGISLGLIYHETSISVPLHPFPDQESTYPLTPVKIWKDNPFAYDYSHHIPDSLHCFLNPSGSIQRGRLTLFRVNSSHHREIYRNAPRKKDLGFQPTTGFADAYPLHILGLSSVRDVNAHCASAIPKLSIRRFRANIIVAGPGAFVEDDWKVIRISPSSTTSALSRNKDAKEVEEEEEEGVTIYTACRTIRCKLPNVDPETGFRHSSEPDKTLKAYRRIDRGDLTNACLGMQGVPAVRESRIRVGDKISVLETGEHCYIKMLAPGEVVEGV
ncbi:hypothetical protein BJY04DRAFT_222834 [Aspergillus karnatakaensis]|uniref:MOSC domain protein n=1 Tax=Aspergillus karnatakaensis TaxID=1810916 RepID=UPI003CCDE2D6